MRRSEKKGYPYRVPVGRRKGKGQLQVVRVVWRSAAPRAAESGLHTCIHSCASSNPGSPERSVRKNGWSPGEILTDDESVIEGGRCRGGGLVIGFSGLQGKPEIFGDPVTRPVIR